MSNDKTQEPTLHEKQRAALKLIKMMETDVLTALTTGAPLVIEGKGPLGALLSVLQVAEKATTEKLIPIFGAEGGDYNTAEKRLISDLASRECETGEEKCSCLPCRARHLIDSERS